MILGLKQYQEKYQPIPIERAEELINHPKGLEGIV